jgi:hypothetical protein
MEFGCEVLQLDRAFTLLDRSICRPSGRAFGPSDRR